MGELDPVHESTELPQEIERRVGRNLLLYQRIENVLKFMLTFALAEGTPSDHERRTTARITKVMRLNMGDAVGAVFDQVLTAEPRHAPAKHDPNEIWMRTMFSIEPSPDRPGEFDLLRERCQSVVNQRNALVHHFLRQAQLWESGNVAIAATALDEQHTTALALRGELRGLLNGLKAVRQETAAYFASDSGRGDFELAMAQAAIVDTLADIARQTRREDGWEFVTTALNRLNASGKPSSDVLALKKRWGNDWVEKLFEIASDVFEVTSEPLPNGTAGTRRQIYRLRRD